MSTPEHANAALSHASRYRWTILLLGTYIIACYGFVFQTIPPILTHLIRDLSISYSQAGALMGGFAIPAIFFAIPTGLLLDRLGVRKIAVGALIVFVTGAVIVAGGANYSIFLSGRFICGTGAVALLVCVPRLIAQWFESAELGLAIGVFNAAVPLGTIFAMMGLGVLAESHGWHTVLVVSAAVSVSALVLFFAFYRDRDSASAAPHTGGDVGLRSYLRACGKRIWLLGIAWAIFGAGYFQFFTFAFEYFVAKGISVEKVGLYASGPMLSGILTGPVVGWLLDKYERGWVFLLIGYVGLVLTLGLVPVGLDYAFLLTLVIGILGSVVATVAFALPPAIMPAHTLGFGYGLLSALLGLGSFVGAIGLGLLRDMTEIGGSVFVGAAVVSLLAIPATLALRKADLVAVES